jgi:hypothetical protein
MPWYNEAADKHLPWSSLKGKDGINLNLLRSGLKFKEDVISLDLPILGFLKYFLSKLQ